MTRHIGPAHRPHRTAARRTRSLILPTLALLAISFGGCAWLELAAHLGGAHDAPPPLFRELSGFAIDDPYAVPGEWLKVQLHVHTAGSVDSDWPADDALQAYAEAGYDAVALTDHNRVTLPEALPESMVFITGVESNLPGYPFPLGPHAVFLGVAEPPSGQSVADRFAAVDRDGGLVVLAHPAWNGNAGTGHWELWQAVAAPHFHLVEIVNPHASTAENEAFWHRLVGLRGPDRPAWATAVDDAHAPAAIGFGWSMVKAEAKTAAAVLDALRRGSHYATTGVLAEFGVTGGEITVTASVSVRIEFIDGYGRTVHRADGHAARYRPTGAEGFVRVRLYDPASGRRAWSQPFWLREG